MNNSSEITPRTLDDSILEGVHLSHEALLRKREQVELYTAHYEDASGEQNITCAYIPGDGNNKKTDITNVAWSDSANREHNLLRFSGVAEVTGSDILLVSFPGYRENKGDGLTPIQLTNLTRANEHSFSEVGKALASAVQQVTTLKRVDHNYWSDREITVVSDSQGSSSQLGMLGHLNPEIIENITKIILWESPDTLSEQRKFKELGLKFFKDAMKTGNRYYLANEEAFGKKEAETLGVHDKGLKGMAEFVTMLATNYNNLTNGALDAMGGSTLRKDFKWLNGIGALDNKEIVFMYGNASLVSTEEMNQRIINMLIKNAPKTGEKTLIVHRDGTHGRHEDFRRAAAERLTEEN